MQVVLWTIALLITLQAAHARAERLSLSQNGARVDALISSGSVGSRALLEGKDGKEGKHNYEGMTEGEGFTKPPTTPSSSPPTGGCGKFLHNTVVDADTFKDVPAKDEFECFLLCVNDLECTAMSYKPSTGFCWLRKDIRDTMHDDEKTSYIFCEDQLASDRGYSQW